MCVHDAAYIRGPNGQSTKRPCPALWETINKKAPAFVLRLKLYVLIFRSIVSRFDFEYF